MAMSKATLRTWPHNGQPSKRHVWKELGLSKVGNGYCAICLRCGRFFNSVADTRGPVYCYAKPEWIAANPADNPKLGKPPFEGGME